jgi:hypothetical protein
MIYKMADGANMPTPQKARYFVDDRFLPAKNSLPPSGRGIIPPSKSRGFAFVFIIVLMVP